MTRYDSEAQRGIQFIFRDDNNDMFYKMKINRVSRDRVYLICRRTHKYHVCAATISLAHPFGTVLRTVDAHSGRRKFAHTVTPDQLRNISNYTPIPHKHTYICMPRQDAVCHLTSHLACQMTGAELAKVQVGLEKSPAYLSEKTSVTEIQELQPSTPMVTVGDTESKMMSDIEASDDSEPTEVRKIPRIRLRKRE